MNKPSISIIVPVYNTVEYVEECIQSILSQTYKNIELILVNDGGTDGSGDICKRYDSLSNVHYIEQENMGATAARERGVEESHGEWIMFVDSDDYLLPCAVEKMIEMAIDSDIVIGTDQYDILRNERDIIDRYQYLIRAYERKITVGIAPKLYRRILFNNSTFNFSSNITYGEDWLMNLHIAIENKKNIRVCKTPVYYYRENLSSICHMFNYSMDYFVLLCNTADLIVKNHIQEADAQRGAANLRMDLIYKVLRYHKFKIDTNHPFIDDTKYYLKKADLYSFSRWLLLNFPSKIVYKLSRYNYKFEK